jgi:hypothetical protein
VSLRKERRKKNRKERKERRERRKNEKGEKGYHWWRSGNGRALNQRGLGLWVCAGGVRWELKTCSWFPLAESSLGREILREESDGGKWRKAREWKIIIKNEIAWGWSAINMKRESDKSHFGETIAS